MDDDPGIVKHSPIGIDPLQHELCTFRSCRSASAAAADLVRIPRQELRRLLRGQPRRQPAHGGGRQRDRHPQRQRDADGCGSCQDLAPLQRGEPCSGDLSHLVLGEGASTGYGLCLLILI